MRPQPSHQDVFLDKLYSETPRSDRTQLLSERRRKQFLSTLQEQKPPVRPHHFFLSYAYVSTYNIHTWHRDRMAS